MKALSELKVHFDTRKLYHIRFPNMDSYEIEKANFKTIRVNCKAIDLVHVSVYFVEPHRAKHHLEKPKSIHRF